MLCLELDWISFLVSLSSLFLTQAQSRINSQPLLPRPLTRWRISPLMKGILEKLPKGHSVRIINSLNGTNELNMYMFIYSHARLSYPLIWNFSWTLFPAPSSAPSQFATTTMKVQSTSGPKAQPPISRPPPPATAKPPPPPCMSQEQIYVQMDNIKWIITLLINCARTCPLYIIYCATVYTCML